MKIVVLVKHVPEPTAAMRFAEDLTLDRAKVDGRLSELDEYAVEQAVALVEKGLPATVTYLTMGPAKAVDALRKALATGGDDAVHGRVILRVEGYRTVAMPAELPDDIRAPLEIVMADRG